MPTAETSQRIHDWRQALTSAGLDEPVDADFQDALSRVFDASEYVARTAQRLPELLTRQHDAGLLARRYGPGELAARATDAVASAKDGDGLAVALRHLRAVEMVRIIWRDVAGTAELDETLSDLSQLAELSVDHSLRLLHGWLAERHGDPVDGNGQPLQLLVLAMGKLGAGELNLSSDIDLILAYAEQGETDGRRSISNQEFFIKLGRQLVSTLSKVTGDGFVFRVDLRLRPFGDAGPVAMSFDALESYYASQARTWERYAMIKARAISGSERDREDMHAMLRPFVYRRYVDFSAIEAIRDMKRRIEAELRGSGIQGNVKLGRGGIREIEFIGQAFQLIRGGRDPELRIRPIRQVLRRLGEKELLPATSVSELDDAYVFLRRVENRLQAWRDEQTHNLPDGDDDRARLARSMDMRDWSELDTTLSAHRDRVHQHFRDVFADSYDDEAPTSDAGAPWPEPDGDPSWFANHGFTDAVASASALQDFAESGNCRALSARGRERLDRLIPSLLPALADTAQPDVALTRLLALLHAIVRRTAYLDLLGENPAALTQLVRLSSDSAWIAEQLRKHPLLLDELLDPRVLYSPLHRSELTQQLRTSLSQVEADDLEQQMERLRQFAHGNMLRIAAADITGAIPLMVVSDYLSEIAEVTLDAVLELARAPLLEKHGAPGADGGFGIIAYGKLGGLELGYGSDLDLVFIHGGSGNTAGPKTVPNEVFFARLAQRMIHLLTTRTLSGELYEIDLRLRPNGNSGLMVSPVAAFERYQRESAWTWEHQALLRARFISGDPQLKDAFERVRREVLARPRNEGQLRTEVVEMREKMRAAMDRGNDTEFDLKQGLGGIADIEFMVQFAVLRSAHNFPDLLDWTDNIRLLERLARHQLLPANTAELLTNTYKVFRAAYHRNALQLTAGLLPGDHLQEERVMIRETWADLMQG